MQNSLPTPHLPYLPHPMQQPISYSHSIGSWVSQTPVPINPNYQTHQLPNMYSPVHHGWPTQPVLPPNYNHQVMSPLMPEQYVAPNNVPINQIQASQPQVRQLVDTGQSHPLATTTDTQITQRELGSHLQQPTGPYRNDRFNSKFINQDDTAWVEEATAVTGATSETGLSGGDNLSRFGARYGLATSLGMHSGGPGAAGVSGAVAALIRSDADDVKVFTCSHSLSLLASAFIGLAAILSPVLMLLIPFFPFWIGWSTEACEPTCEGNLIGISVKLILLLFATWVLSAPCRPFHFGRTAILPRIRLYRTLFLCLVFVVLFAFWLFYSVRVIQPRESDYLSIVLFANSLTDTLLFLHYTGIALMELRRIRFHYAIRIVRSPDGMSKTLKCGEMSLQRAALEVLQFYMLEFTAYNPNQAPPGSSAINGKRGRRTGTSSGGNGGGSKYKFYDVDGGTDLTKSGTDVNYTVDQSGGGGTAPSASARLYEEIEMEKRIRKRRMRLLLAVEEAFTHVKRLAVENCDSGVSAAGVTGCEDGAMTTLISSRSNGRIAKSQCSAGKSLDPYEAAQAVFPTLIRPLQKYMRATRQQSRHPVDMVIDHLALCLAYGLSPNAFLERFNPLTATPQQDAAAAASAIVTAKRARKHQQRASERSGYKDIQDSDPLLPKHVHPGGQQIWSIVADRALSHSLADGAVFQLRRGSDVSLLCTVRQLPLIYLVEEILEPLEAGRFTLRTENSV